MKDLSRGWVLTTVLLFLLLSFTNDAFAVQNHRFWYDADFAALYDDNVYKDINSYIAAAYDFNLAGGVRSKLAGNTYSGLQGVLNTVTYADYSYENIISGEFKTFLKHRISDYVTLDIAASLATSAYPASADFNTAKLAAGPYLTWYVLDYTSLKAGMEYTSSLYPNYDLDSLGPVCFVGLDQELGLYSSASLSLSLGSYEYSERSKYALLGGSMVLLDEKRLDRYSRLDASVSRSISRSLSASVFAGYQVYDSSGNYFDWGPSQWEGNDITISDNAVIEDYYSYSDLTGGVRVSLSLKKAVAVNASFSAGKRNYPGRPAKDELGALLTPGVLRSDTVIRLSAEVSKSLFKAGPLGSAGLSVRYNYDGLSTNDAYYNYANNTVGVSMTFWR